MHAGFGKREKGNISLVNIALVVWPCHSVEITPLMALIGLLTYHRVLTGCPCLRR